MCKDHIQECFQLEKTPFNRGFDIDDPNSYNNNNNNNILRLPVIEGDAGFQRLNRNDEKIVSTTSLSTDLSIYLSIIYQFSSCYHPDLPSFAIQDEQLTLISKHVAILKEMAESMGKVTIPSSFSRRKRSTKNNSNSTLSHSLLNQTHRKSKHKLQ